MSGECFKAMSLHFKLVSQVAYEEPSYIDCPSSPRHIDTNPEMQHHDQWRVGGELFDFAPKLNR